MRTARLAAITAAMLVGVLAGCVPVDTDTEVAGRDGAGTAADRDTEPSSEPTTAQEPETTPEPEPTTTEPEPEPEPEAELGTRENPAAVGSDVATFTEGADEVTVTLAEANWDANAVVQGENQFNDPPADGMVFVILPVTATYSGPESMLPWIDLEITFLADNGRSYEEAFAVIPDDLSEVSDIYDGGSATGNVLFELPADQVPGGMWGVSYNWSDPLWWEAA